MNASATDGYLARFRRVLEHVEAHLEEALTVERLAGVAAFSKFHFHRQWAELFGVGVHQYVQLVRLRRASYQLAFRDGGIIDIALGSGYESHEAFSRAFKKAIGQTPSDFRQQPQWELWHATYQHLHQVRSRHMQPEHRPESVRIVECPRIRVGVFEHRGDPRQIGDSIRRFIAWRRENDLHPRKSATFNVFWDDPEQTAPEEFRMDLCAAIERPVAANEHGVVEKALPAGRCAVLRHVGSDDSLGDTLKYLYAEWLPASGEEPRDYPLYVQRVRMFPDVPEHEAVTDVFLPLE
jgi:AraC family transcriptional regulator